jgi:hypothetical protein
MNLALVQFFEQRVELLHEVRTALAQQLTLLGESQRACSAVDQMCGQLLFMRFSQPRAVAVLP